jgi:superfamily II DNA/RNA helicase
LLFSATLDGDIAVLSRDYQTDPVRHEAGTVENETIDATHHFWLVQHHDRIQHTADLIRQAGRSIVFTRTRHGADRLAKQLGRVGVGAVAMHGGRSQAQRNRALKEFSSGRAMALIATDVAARGIHIDAVASVIHFDLAGDHKDYLHRSGRTARAGATGTVVSLITRDQQSAVRKMQRELDLQVPIEEPRLASLGERQPIVERPLPKRVAKAPAKRTAKPTPPPAPKRPRHKTSGEQSVFVGNLPWKATDTEIRDLFVQFGQVHKATIIKNRRTGRSKGFGFVDMPHHAARNAVEGLNGSSFDGRDLQVRLAHPEPSRP